MRNDSRMFAAFPYRANAVLVCLPHLYDVVLIDISEHAALVWATGNAGIRRGAVARLRVLTENGNQAFELRTVVAHSSGHGIALEIDAIDRHARDSLQRLLGADRGAPQLASRTLSDLIEANSQAPRPLAPPWPGAAGTRPEKPAGIVRG